MGKLVTLKFHEGSFEQGFLVTLHISEEAEDTNEPLADQSLAYRPIAEVMGRLPSDRDLPQFYQQWQSSYARLGLPSRLEAPRHQITNVSVLEDCQQAADQLRDRLNQWLRHEAFRPIREKWLENLQVTDLVRVIVQTDDGIVQRLPWHLWEIVDRYRRSEIALGVPTYERVQQSRGEGPIRILAILGNSTGIDVQADRQMLEQLPDAKVCFLVEPERRQLTDQLWSQAWDILFFAGHSSSQTADPAKDLQPAQGRIYINATESLTIAELRYSLRQAVAQGLKLAIFNSCDGLGLARDLADLQIPQLIVMREPVPDRVAQAFLNYFLQFFSQGEPLYLAVRWARERLQGLEDEFPCATWLPMICQNPAARPPTWQWFKGPLNPQPISTSGPEQAVPTTGFPLLALPQRTWKLRPLSPFYRRWGWRLLISLLITIIVLIVRQTGILQPIELMAYDQLLRLRPAEAPDPRLYLITIDEAERQKYGQTVTLLDGTPTHISLADRYLNQLLENLDRAQPRVIGLDLYRDFRIPAEDRALADRFRQNPHLIGICKGRFLGKDSIAPPPDLAGDRVGFSDFVSDPDQVLRRHLLAMTTPHIDAPYACTAPLAFSVEVASRYLQAIGVSRTIDQAGNLRWHHTLFHSLEPRSGGYQTVDTGGSQILLNYRATPMPVAATYTLTEVLNGEMNPDAVQDNIVLIGVTGTTNHSSDDIWQTPIDPAMPGVVVQAHMISQILSHVLDHRPLIQARQFWNEAFWIGIWSLIGGLLIQRFRISGRLGCWLGLAIALLYGGCLLGLIQGVWLPLVPSLLSFLLTSGVMLAWRFRIRHLS